MFLKLKGIEYLMLIVAAYDVDMKTEAGAKRLRKVAKICERWGIRVQNSVFELMVNEHEFILLQAALKSVIDETSDNVRFYRLGNHFENKISFIGKSPIIQQGGDLIL